MVRSVATIVAFGLALAVPRAARAGDDPDPSAPGAPAPEAPTTGDPGDADAPPDPAPDPKEAKRWIAAGDTLMKRGDQLARRNKAADARSQYERALVSYQKAYELTQNPQVYFAIAAAEEKLGRSTDALLHYRKVTLAVTGNAQLVELATQRLAALAQDVGLFTASVDPPGAALALDGSPIGTAPMAEPIVLQPGSYTLQITADGYQPLEIKLVIDAGSESERTFKLEPVPVVFEKPVEAPRPVVHVVVPAPSKVPLWIGGVAALALAGTATTTGVVALKKHSTFIDDTATPEARDQARRTGKTLSMVTDLCLGGAVLAAGFTAYWYFKVYRPAARVHRRSAAEATRPREARRDGVPRPKLVVAPWVQSSAGGVALAVTY